jgi:acetyltransferase-like isoleucine patch superfamily enzyme/glycosyltransferase involved in cell wall biosynthesis
MSATSLPVAEPAEQQKVEPCTYVLVTSAYNEEERIGQTIESVLQQTVLPLRWVIVSDGSADGTDRIVQSYAEKYDFIRFLRIERAPGRSFGSKVRALQAGSKLLEGTNPSLIGNLDADVTMGPDYFESLIACFERHPSLGIAGGFVCEETDGEFRSRRSNRSYSVAHAAQLVRRECYDAIGGYAALEYGGEDWHAQISAQMRGWKTEAFPEFKIFHHRHTGEGGNLVRHKFRQGRMDYSLGSDVWFEILKCLERLPEKPLLLGSLSRLTGFFWSAIRRDSRPVSAEFVAFLRQDQRQRISTLMKGRGRTAADNERIDTPPERPDSMKKPSQTPLADPISLLGRLMSRVYTWWLRLTYPFAALGSDFWAHYSCDLSREAAPYLKIGTGVKIDRDVWLTVPMEPDDGQPTIILDDGCKIGRRCMISAKNRIHIGRDVIFGPSVLVTDHLHAFEDVSVPITFQGITAGGTIRIEEGCWIGFGAAVICSQGELVLGKNSVVGANSVVTRSVPAYSVVVGNPARVVKQFDPVREKWVLGATGRSASHRER